MNAWTPKRRSRGAWITDWRDIAERVFRASIVLGWFSFVAVMLAMVLERAP